MGPTGPNRYMAATLDPICQPRIPDSVYIIHIILKRNASLLGKKEPGVKLTKQKLNGNHVPNTSRYIL